MVVVVVFGLVWGGVVRGVVCWRWRWEWRDARRVVGVVDMDMGRRRERERERRDILCYMLEIERVRMWLRDYPVGRDCCIVLRNVSDIDRTQCSTYTVAQLSIINPVLVRDHSVLINPIPIPIMLFCISFYYLRRMTPFFAGIRRISRPFDIRN